MDDLELMSLRYGAVATGGAESARIEVRLNRARAHRDHIDGQLAQLAVERARVEDEIRRLVDLDTLVRHDDADRIRRLRGEGWSPTPVVGFRAWRLHPEMGAMGATNFVWRSSRMVASCDKQRTPVDDIPHTDHRCSQYGHGCGIYATKTAGSLDFEPVNFMYGAVLMSGKVVEHELGYRAAEAQVAALVAWTDARLMATTDCDKINDLFADPIETCRKEGVEAEGPIVQEETQNAIVRLERSLN